MTKKIFEIGYAISNAYCHCLATSICSILKNSKECEHFNFYILHSDITDENKRKINKLRQIKDFYIEYIRMNNDDFRNISKGVSIVSNYRVKIASVKPHLNKILFLDADIIVLDSLEELYNTDLQANYIAAVVDPGVKVQYEYTFEDREKFPDKRFNTGVMLANLAKWREDNVEEKIMQSMVWYSTKYQDWPDQNVLNMVFKDHIHELSHAYNVCPILAQQGWYQENGVWDIASSNPKILHYCGHPKYWEAKDMWWSEIFWEYARLTPYYEDFLMLFVTRNNDILYRRIQKFITDYVKTQNKMPHQKIEEAKKIKWKIRKYRILSALTFGKKQQYYHDKYLNNKKTLDSIKSST